MSVPNRSGDHSRDRDAGRVRTRKGEIRKARSATASADALHWPEPDPSWSPLAREMYEAAQNSGQAYFYEPSDVFMVRWLAQQMTDYEQSDTVAKNRAGDALLDDEGRPIVVKRRSPEMAKLLLSTMQSLNFSEAARRTARIELERADPERDTRAADAVDLYRARLGLIPGGKADDASPAGAAAMRSHTAKPRTTATTKETA